MKDIDSQSEEKRGMTLDVEITADGSVTLYRPDLNEHYHSVKGALAESRHIYIDLGWRQYAATHPALTVFEVGFGTGLNAALTAQAALNAAVKTNYYAVELYPISHELTAELASQQSEQYLPEYQAVNNAPWNIRVEINRWFTLHKISGDFLTLKIPTGVNVVYFDAFAPDKQPEMWSAELFTRLYEAMTPEAILTTYCAKGAVRRMLQEVGFKVTRMPGPPQGKREVLRAVKPGCKYTKL